MTHSPAHADRFRYDGYELDSSACRLVCRYSVGARRFTEEIGFDGPVGPAGGVAPGGTGGARTSEAVDADAVEAAARLVYLLAGVSYYKVAAPPVVDLGELAASEVERRFLRTFYVEGLAEFAHRNDLDLSRLRIDGDAPTDTSGGVRRRVPVPTVAGRPLVPFGGGIDSIVTAESVRRSHPGASLFVVSRAGARFDAIERAASATGLPVVRADRRIDPALLRSVTLGFLNGHVPVTGILSAIAVLAAVAGGHGAVVMSNERSASVGTRHVAGRTVNHQWSKGLAFETGFREVLAATFEPGVEYFSYLRSRSELWVAERFAALSNYHGVFRSCNRAFHLDPARRLDRWCGTCDKCCFVDLVLAPFLDAATLSAIFGGREPLDDAALAPQFRALLGGGPDAKPFECVGDEEECRTAAVLAAARPDRSGSTLLRALAADAIALGGIADLPDLSALLAPMGADFVPAGFDRTILDGAGAENAGTGGRGTGTGKDAATDSDAGA